MDLRRSVGLRAAEEYHRPAERRDGEKSGTRAPRRIGLPYRCRDQACRGESALDFASCVLFLEHKSACRTVLEPLSKINSSEIRIAGRPVRAGTCADFFKKNVRLVVELGNDDMPVLRWPILHRDGLIVEARLHRSQRTFRDVQVTALLDRPDDRRQPRGIYGSCVWSRSVASVICRDFLRPATK